MSIDEKEARKQFPRRFRRARGDACVKSIRNTIERTLGLPKGSVLLVRPDGRKMRSDAKVSRLRQRWEE